MSKPLTDEEIEISMDEFTCRDEEVYAQAREANRLRTENERLSKLIEQTVLAWNKWADAPGWNNNEYDDLAAQLISLEKSVKESLGK